ncbi:bestrophin-4-like [Planococcus citri]|uniref:bestrophin-4-like n=1 Tax=Planococcus citri TaxID=170843 RepID=UPI0031F75720
MTVSYQYKVASSTSGGFTRLLFMWRGSLYKLIYRELLIFLLAFDILSVLYRNLFSIEQKKFFERLVKYCDTFISLIPLTFILGFYVSYVANRWWQQYEAIPWPDRTMHALALYVPGSDEHERIVRRTLMRYLNLTLVLILRSISSAVKRRFPTVDHLTEVGFMTESEKEMFLSVSTQEFNTYWIPCAWFIHLLRDYKDAHPDMDETGLKLIMEEFNSFRAKCGLLWSYDWISIPLVYTQVVTLATYSFFIAAVVGRQYVEHSNQPMQMEIDTYLPIFTVLQFLFYMGLLKVAEQLINPFGDDDEDFELNWLIDRHIKVSYLGVDTLMLHNPPLQKDKYFDDDHYVLPYTAASIMHKKRTYRGSVANMQVPEEQQNLYLPEIIEEEGNEESYVTKFTSTNDEDRDYWRQNVDSGKQHRDKPSQHNDTEEETIVNNIRFKRISPSISRSNTLKRNNSGSNLSANSGRDDNAEPSRRNRLTKHNSLLYHSGRRPSSVKRFNEKDAFRRKSVAASARDSTLNRTSSKWSLHRDSAIDAQWKGIRWKPFKKDDIYTINSAESSPNRDSLHRSGQIASFPDDYASYVNQMFSASVEELSPANLMSSNNKKGKRANTESIECDNKNNKTARKSSLNISLQDSLV